MPPIILQYCVAMIITFVDVINNHSFPYYYYDLTVLELLQIIKICLSRLTSSVWKGTSPPLEIGLHIFHQLLLEISRVQGRIRGMLRKSIALQCCATSVIFSVISFSSRIAILIGRILVPRRWSVWQVAAASGHWRHHYAAAADAAMWWSYYKAIDSSCQ